MGLRPFGSFARSTVPAVSRRPDCRCLLLLLPYRCTNWEDYQTRCSVLCPRAGPRVNVADRETMGAAG